MNRSTSRALAGMLFNPMNLDFPIFWVPIMVPLALTAIIGWVDLLALGTLTSSKFSMEATAILPYINASFISTDVWALTTAISASHNFGADPRRGIAIHFGILIALLWHLVAFLISRSAGLVGLGYGFPLSLSLAGLVGLLLMRLSVFVRIEDADLRRRESALDMEPRSVRRRQM